VKNKNILFDRNELKYRQSTSAVIFDKLGRILVVQKMSYKNDEWDIPGGGIEEGERSDQAVLRELGEELGCDEFEIINVSKKKDCYEWPDEVIVKKFREKGIMYRGQKRTQFLVKFTGEEIDLKIQIEEIRIYKWVFPKELDGLLVFPEQLDRMKLLLEEFGV